VILERFCVTSQAWRSSRHLRLLIGGVLHPRQALLRQHFVRDSGTCLWDVTHTWCTFLLRIFCTVGNASKMRRRQQHMCKRGNL